MDNFSTKKSIIFEWPLAKKKIIEKKSTVFKINDTKHDL